MSFKKLKKLIIFFIISLVDKEFLYKFASSNNNYSLLNAGATLYKLAQTIWQIQLKFSR
jgi:hypothetical protein